MVAERYRMMKNKSTVILVFLLAGMFFCPEIVSRCRAAQHDKITLAVLNFRARGVPLSYAGIAGNYLEMALLRHAELVLLERGQVKSAYRSDEVNRYSCQDDSCAVLAGRALSADYVVLGDVVRNGRYAIEARVVSVKSETAVFSCTVKYGSQSGAKKAARIAAKKIAAALMGLRDTSSGRDDIKARAAAPVYIDAHADFAVFQPFDRFSRLVRTGLGFTCGIMVSGMSPVASDKARNISVGFDSGLLYSPGRINSDDSFIMAPFSFSLGYQVPVAERFYLMPLISGGFSYLAFRHERGDGFDMEDRSQKWSIDPHFRVSLVMGVLLAMNIRLELVTAFWVLCELPDSPYFFTAHLGLNWRFEVP